MGSFSTIFSSMASTSKHPSTATNSQHPSTATNSQQLTSTTAVPTTEEIFSPTFVKTTRISSGSSIHEWHNAWQFWIVVTVGVLILIFLLAIGILQWLLLVRKKKEALANNERIRVSDKKLEENRKETKPAEEKDLVQPAMVESRTPTASKSTTIEPKNIKSETVQDARKDINLVGKNPLPSLQKTVEKAELFNITELETQLTEDSLTDSALFKYYEEKKRKKKAEENKEKNKEENKEEDDESSTKTEAIVDIEVYDDSEKTYDNLSQYSQPTPAPPSISVTKQGSSNDGSAPSVLSTSPTINPSIGNKVSINNTSNNSKNSTANVPKAQ